MSTYDLAKFGGLSLSGGQIAIANATETAAIKAQIRDLHLRPSAAGNVAAVISADALLSGLLTTNPGAAINLTTPSAVAIVAADTCRGVGLGYRFAILNVGAFAATLVAGAGVAIVGSAGVASTTSAQFYLYESAIASGAEAVTIYRL